MKTVITVAAMILIMPIVIVGWEAVGFVVAAATAMIHVMAWALIIKWAWGFVRACQSATRPWPRSDS